MKLKEMVKKKKKVFRAEDIEFNLRGGVKKPEDIHV